MMRSSSEEHTATGGGSDWSATTIDVISTPHAQGKNGIITVRNSDIETIFRKRVRKIKMKTLVTSVGILACLLLIKSGKVPFLCKELPKNS